MKKQNKAIKEELTQTDKTQGKWNELIEIMDELSAYRAHFVVLLAKLYRDMERNGK